MTLYMFMTSQRNYDGDFTDLCAVLICLTSSDTTTGGFGFTYTLPWEGVSCGNGKVRQAAAMSERH